MEPTTSHSAGPAPAPPVAPLIEVGWVLAGSISKVDVRAVQQARLRMLRFLREQFPAFMWRMPVVRRRELEQTGKAEPVVLLDVGVAERDTRRWDYALVVTEAELQSYYKPFALGAPSQTLSVAVLSTARLDPAATLEDVDDAERRETMARRVLALALHLFGHLNDLDHRDDPADVMFNPDTAQDLDAPKAFAEEDHRRLEAELKETADVRLEELGTYRGHALRFYLRAMWRRRDDILSAVGETRPWLFPLRFSRLTTAAMSTLLILTITAEAWDLGMSQIPAVVLMLSLAALAGTSLYILKRQQLLVRRRLRRLSEQRVVGNVAIVLAVALGMMTTYVLLFAVTLTVSQVFFSAALVQTWAASVGGTIHFGHYLVLAGFVASLGLLIGALGASFEAQGYFRHVAYVDEET